MIRTFYAEKAELKPGVRRYLEQFRKAGIPMAVATSSGRENVEAAFRRLSVLDLFQDILTCSEVGQGKIIRRSIWRQQKKLVQDRKKRGYLRIPAMHF